jgi:hypothetical protein
MKRLHPVAWAILPLFLVATFAVIAAEKPKRQSSPKGAEVYFVTPKDGETVARKFKVIFGLTGMGVCPAGITAADAVPYPDTGHHHLLVDQEKLPPIDEVLPVDKPEICLHFGKGQTETMLELTPGKHTLQLVFADYAHVPHDPPVISKKITVTVK